MAKEPPKVLRVPPPTRLARAIPATTVPAMDSQLATTLARSTNRSTTSTSNAVPARTSSGRMAWKSMATVRVSSSCEQVGEPAGDRRVGQPQDQAGGEAEGHGEHDQRGPGGGLDRGQVTERLAGPAVGGPAEVDPLDEPEEVAGGQQRPQQADRGQGPEQGHRQPGGRVPGGQQGQDLAPEAGQPGQAEGGDAGQGEYPGQVGHEGGHAAAQLDDVAGVG